MANDYTGTLMPAHHKAKCSWKDCTSGYVLDNFRLCTRKGMWWHQSCPCWEELHINTFEYDKQNDVIEGYFESQVIKDNLFNLLVWIDQESSTKDYYDTLVDIAYREFKGLIYAMNISSGKNRREIMLDLKKFEHLEIMFYLLLLKLASVSNVLADIITEEE